MKVFRCEVTKEMGVEFLVAAEDRAEATKAAEEIAEGIDNMDWEVDSDGSAYAVPIAEITPDLLKEIKLYGIWVGGPEGAFVYDTRLPEPEPVDTRLPGPGQDALPFDGPVLIEDVVGTIGAMTDTPEQPDPNPNPDPDQNDQPQPDQDPNQGQPADPNAGNQPAEDPSTAGQQQGGPTN